MGIYRKNCKIWEITILKFRRDQGQVKPCPYRMAFFGCVLAGQARQAQFRPRIYVYKSDPFPNSLDY